MFRNALCIGLLVLWNAVSFAQPLLLNRQNPLSTVESAKFLNIEAPFRCAVQDYDFSEISTTLVLKKGDFQISRFEHSDKLPAFQVDGYTFSEQPIDEAIQTLVLEAGIDVYTADDGYLSVSAEDIYGELTAVMDSLSYVGDVFYRYNAKEKRIYLSRRAPFVLQLPANTAIMLSVLDALRGAAIPDITPNWEKYTISLNLTQEQLNTVQELINFFLEEGKVLLLESRLFLINSSSAGVAWSSILKEMGPHTISETKQGALGSFLSYPHQEENIIKKLSKKYTVMQLSEGIALVPNNWKARFDIGRCASNKNLSDLSLLLKTDIHSIDSMRIKVSLDTLSGEATSFSTITGLDDEMVLLGIPATLVQMPAGEIAVTLKVHLIRLQKGV